MSNQNNENNKSNPFLKALKTMGTWLRRMFMGASKDLANQDVFAVEKLESPSKLAVKSFFRRKLAVAALVVLISLFLFVFIGPLFIPMDERFSDNNQANVAPGLNMMSVPRDLADNVRTISGFSRFTVGVSEENNLYIWGSVKDALKGIDFSKFPEEIEEGNVYLASAGLDHIIAITTDGKVVGWGANGRGQYGEYEKAEEDGILVMPEMFLKGTIDVSKVSKLVCGYQATAVVYDGELFMWGNTKALLNMESLVQKSKEYMAANEGVTVKDVALGNFYGTVLFSDNTLLVQNEKASGYSNKTDARITNVYSKVNGKVIDIAATDNCFAYVTEDGTIYVSGAYENGENIFPEGSKNLRFVEAEGGTKHFIAKTSDGRAYGWGYNRNGQTNLDGVESADIFAGSNQSYVLNEDSEISFKTGLKGYIFGTDGSGRDVFARIVHGGKMTMTVGAVAVIVSSIIAIIVGCLSGYFGGWVDMLLMRVTEIFSSIPFLPFAMLLSYVLMYTTTDETTRILIIMIILGLLSWTGLARMIRGQVLAEREKEFVLAAKSMGIKEKRIAFKHILPNIISVIIVSMTLDFAGCLLTESSLSYLGFGVQQPTPTWGNMLDGANNSIIIQNFWWQWVFPSIFLAIATISINIIGDTLRDVLDPKSSQEK